MSAASVSAGLDQGHGHGIGQPPLPTFPGMSMSEQLQQPQQSQGDGSTVSLAGAITTDPQVDHRSLPSTPTRLIHRP